MTLKNAVVAGWSATMVGVAPAAPLVSGVRMVPRADSCTVDIYYRLTGGAAYVTLAVETNAVAEPVWSGVKIPDEHVTRLSGDVSVLVAPDDEKEKHIVWNAGEDWPGQTVAEARARVSAWAPENPPLFLVLDLGDAYNTNAIQMLAYANEEALPYGGLKSDLYRTNLLALRRVNIGSFWMGSPASEVWHQSNEDWQEVTLTNDFYIGVFEVTQGQWARVMSTSPSGNVNSTGHADKQHRSVENVAYSEIRGGTWPQPDAVGSDSFIGRLRAKTGGLCFDLPTEAQWEYACRAGTQTALNNGTVLTTTSAPCPNRNPIAWDHFNSGTAPGLNRRHHRVGEKQPNAWGLYDMLGNVNEVVRDWYATKPGTAPMIEPSGPLTGSSRTRKGGAYDGQRDPRSGYRMDFTPSPSIGFRLALLPSVSSADELSVRDFSFEGPLGSQGATVEKLGPEHFKINLTSAPGNPAWRNMCQFAITNHATGKALKIQFADYATWSGSGGNEKSGLRRFGSWSYDMQTWHPVVPVNIGGKATLVFPTFTKEHVTFGGEVPMAYETLLALIDEWQKHPDVTVHTIGTSVEGRAIHRVTVTATNSPYAFGCRWGHHFVTPHCYEYNAQWRIAGMIDWLLSEEASEYRQRNVCHFVVQMNVDGAHNGFGRVNCEGIDMNRSYSVSGWANNPTTESKAIQRDLEQLAASATPITTTWDMHTWEGAQTEGMVRPGPEMGTPHGDWTAFRDLLEGYDANNQFKVLYTVTSPLTPTTWTSGTHMQFGNTAFCIEGGGNLYTQAEALHTGRVLMKSLVEFYTGTKP